MIHSHHIKLLCLLETKVKAPKMGDLYLNICPNWCFTINLSFHKSGRIVLAWDSDVFTVSIIHMGSQIIHCLITSRNTGDKKNSSFVYGLHTPRERGREPVGVRL